MFIPKKTDLNDEQWAAVNDPQSTLIIACPGSGKTRTLTYKIAIELSKLTNTRHSIVAITYTNAAAEEIKERIEKLGAPTDQLWIGTIHSFCLEWILRPYALYHKKLKRGFTLLNAFDTDEMLKTICADICKILPKPKITAYDCKYYATKTGFEKSSPDDYKWARIDQALDTYWETLNQNRQIDFEQILYYSYELIENMPLISTILKDIFPFILIDEFQDTKEIQYEIVFSILRAGKSQSKLLIVGDPNQSIYEGMGGFPMNKEDMEAKLGFSLTQYPLSQNYRSSEIIINYFDAYKTFPNKINAAGEDTHYQSLITYNHTVSNDKLVGAVANIIQYHVETKGIRPEEICIAGPQWIPLAVFTRSLMITLPKYSFDGPGMAPFAKDIDNFWYKLSRILLTEPAPDMYMRRIRWAGEIVHELSEAGIAFDWLDSKYFLKVCNSLSIDETEGIAYLQRGFDSIIAALHVDMDSCQLMVEHYGSFFKSANARIALLKKDGHESISSLENFKNVFKQREGIRISTIHGIKGTEFDVVIGFGLLNGWVPHNSDDNGAISSKKMMYVLSSRARKNLHLFSETGRMNYRQEALTPTTCLWDYQYRYGEI